MASLSSHEEIADHAQPAGFAATLLAVAGRFWPTRRLALAALRAFRKRGVVPRLVIFRLNGRRITLDLEEVVDAKVFLYGAYDERGLRLIKRVMRAVNCRTALDVGANIGNHTAYFCDWAQRVYSFEPNPLVFMRLQSFVSDNRLANVKVFQCGLSDEDGELTYYIFPGQAHITTFNPGPGFVRGGRAFVRRGDSIVEENRVANIDVVKIDAEEHEYEVLRGIQGVLARERPILFMEFKQNSISKFGSPEGLAALLPGYRIIGTGQGLMSRLFKTALRIEPFVIGKYYSHLLCVPETRIGELRRIVSTRRAL
jgi:FkbM family methyltransferase